MELRPHDLLQIQGMEDLIGGLPFPDWMRELQPWAVVRRAEGAPGLIPVGVRGTSRGQRYAAWLSPEKIRQVIRPSSLTDPANWQAVYAQKPSDRGVQEAEGRGAERRWADLSGIDLPGAVRTLQLLTPLLQAMGYHWGPTGSCGFELATGIRTLTAASDLDLVIEAPSMIPLPAAISLLASLEAQATVRLDVQLNTPAGGVTLKEYNRGGSVLVKTSAAPVIKPFLSLWE